MKLNKNSVESVQYETPHIDQIQIVAEGVLCGSTNYIDDIEFEFEDFLKE